MSLLSVLVLVAIVGFIVYQLFKKDKSDGGTTPVQGGGVGSEQSTPSPFVTGDGVTVNERDDHKR